MTRGRPDPPGKLLVLRAPPLEHTGELLGDRRGCLEVAAGELREEDVGHSGLPRELATARLSGRQLESAQHFLRQAIPHLYNM